MWAETVRKSRELEDQKLNNRRIAKNTMLLYIRMLVTMLVSLYTSRVVLNVLGVDDFGIYNVVGAVVVLFSFISNAMSTSVQRSLNYEIGRGNEHEVGRIFSMCMSVQIVIALIVVLIGETIGLWIVSCKLVIPPDRMAAAHWVYQLSIMACVIKVLRVPYNGMVVAFERMDFFAYLSIAEVMLKLAMVFLLMFASWDKLIYYAALMLLLSAILLWLNKLYCNRNFSTSTYRIFWDKPLFARLMSFSGWTLLGSAADVGVVQGLSVVLNTFIGVVVNAGAGVATQVSGMVYQFVSNFQIAFKPQIIKTYAAGATDDFLKLIYRSAKISFFMLFLISLPILLNTHMILLLWLKQVPEYAVEFCQWTLLYLMVDAISAPLWMSAQAKGDIRNYQILVAVLILSNLPIAYCLLSMGYPPVSVYVAKFVINIVTHFARLIYLNRTIKFPILGFIQEAMAPILIVALISLPIPLYVSGLCDGWCKLIVSTFVSVAVVAAASYFLGLNKLERKALIDFIKKRTKN